MRVTHYRCFERVLPQLFGQGLDQVDEHPQRGASDDDQTEDCEVSLIPSAPIHDVRRSP